VAGFLDKFINKGAKPEYEPELAQKSECLFDSSEKVVTSTATKDSRAEKVIYRQIGQNTYGSGQPPQIYSAGLSAITSYPIIYGAVTAISDAIASLTIKVYDVKGGERVELPDHPFYKLFSRPNPHQGSYEFLDQMSQSLDVFGNVFISVEKIGGEYELYLLNPVNVAIIPDPRVKVKEYRYNINGDIVKYKPEEIIHIKMIDLEDQYYGKPPLSVAADILTFEGNRLNFANQFFVNGAIPSGVLETDSNLGETLLKKLRGEWTRIHKGINNSHTVAILQSGVKYKSISSPLKELDFTALKKLSKEDLLTVFKMPDSILGSKSSKEDLATFWRSCISPRIKRIESAINRGLAVQMFGEGSTRFEFNLKSVDALQEDKGEQAKYLVDLVSSSILTPNEARVERGVAKIDDPYADQLMVSNSFFGNSLIPKDAAIAGAQAGVGADGTNESTATASVPTEEQEVVGS
jgi:HK97 family phage portal protein